MEAEVAHQVLAVGHDSGVTDRMVQRAAMARRAVLTREPWRDDSAVGPPPADIGAHLADFRKTAQELFDDGWRLQSVDLTRLIAIQPVTFTDHYAEIMSSLSADESERVARITLPLPDDSPPLVQSAPDGRAWIVSSNNPHLQVGEAVQDPSAGVLGFKLARATSILKVAELNGRALCLDGHHRAYQLLRRHVIEAPALVRSFSSLAETGVPAGLLSEDVCLGDHPALVADLMSRRVSADVLAAATRKFLVIEARELVLPV